MAKVKKKYIEIDAKATEVSIGNALHEKGREFAEQYFPGGTWEGKNYRVASLDGGKGSSAVFNTDKGYITDFAEGGKSEFPINTIRRVHGLSYLEGFKEADAWLGGGYLVEKGKVNSKVNTQAQARSVNIQQNSKDNQKTKDIGKSNAAVAIYLSSGSTKDSLGERYFQGRNINFSNFASLRFNQNTSLTLTDRDLENVKFKEHLDSYNKANNLDPNNRSVKAPAVIASVTDQNGKTTAIQRIYLNKSGDKLHLNSGAKRTLGSLNGNGVWLGNGKNVDKSRIVVAEGLETALSIKSVFKGPVVAALGASNMQHINIPQETKEVVIAIDNDKAGLKTGFDLGNRLKEQGITPLYAVPKGNDFNDDLKDRGKASLNKSFNNLKEFKDMKFNQQNEVSISERATDLLEDKTGVKQDSSLGNNVEKLMDNHSLSDVISGDLKDISSSEREVIELVADLSIEKINDLLDKDSIDAKTFDSISEKLYNLNLNDLSEKKITELLTLENQHTKNVDRELISNLKDKMQVANVNTKQYFEKNAIGEKISTDNVNKINVSVRQALKEENLLGVQEIQVKSSTGKSILVSCNEHVQVTHENGDKEKLIVTDVNDKGYTAIDKNGETKEISSNVKTDYNYTNIDNKNTQEFLGTYRSEPTTPFERIVQQGEQAYENQISSKVLDQSSDQLSKVDPNLSEGLSKGNLVQLNGNQETVHSLQSVDNPENKTLALTVNTNEPHLMDNKEFLKELDNFKDIVVVTDHKADLETSISSSVKSEVKLQDYDTSQVKEHHTNENAKTQDHSKIENLSTSKTMSM